MYYMYITNKYKPIGKKPKLLLTVCLFCEKIKELNVTGEIRLLTYRHYWFFPTQLQYCFYFC